MKMEIIKIYRAMCDEELAKTVRVPDFVKRFKWFSSNLEFIKNRVQDGKFAWSNFKPEKYRYIVEFEILATDLIHFNSINEKEKMLDRRDLNKIHWISSKIIQ